jgi:DTW domain-containing protein YfiP
MDPMNQQPPQHGSEDRRAAARDVCHTCRKAASSCICEGIVPVENRTRIVIVQHKCERSHPIGTARIASLGLRNMELRVVWPDGANGFTFELDELENPGLLFPGPGATDLATVPAEQRPRELVVLDGSWSDGRKLFKDNPWLEHLPQYSLNPTVPSRYRIRKEPNLASISTIEAVVQALGILEPDTPGLQALIRVFESMIDRQIECARTRPPGPSRYHNRRSRNRDRRSVPRELTGSLRNLVIVDEESVPWKGKKRELIRWFAVRPRDGSVFDQFLTPREGSTLTEDHLNHMGLCRDDMNMTVLPEELGRLWNEFITPEDILVTWNKGVLNLLDDHVDNCQKSFYLKEAYCNTRGGRCGHLKDVVRAHGLPLSNLQLKGRAARKLSSTLAVTIYLNQLSRTSPDHREDLP